MYGLTRGMYVLRHTPSRDVVVAGQLWIVEFGGFFLFFFEHTRHTGINRTPCLIFLLTSTRGTRYMIPGTGVRHVT